MILVCVLIIDNLFVNKKYNENNKLQMLLFGIQNY